MILNPRASGYRPMRDAFSHFHPISPNRPVGAQSQLWKRFTRPDGWDGKSKLHLVSSSSHANAHLPSLPLIASRRGVERSRLSVRLSLPCLPWILSEYRLPPPFDRLDGFIVSNRFVSRLESCEIERSTFCSDHFPVVRPLVLVSFASILQTYSFN